MILTLLLLGDGVWISAAADDERRGKEGWARAGSAVIVIGGDSMKD